MPSTGQRAYTPRHAASPAPVAAAQRPSRPPAEPAAAPRHLALLAAAVALLGVSAYVMTADWTGPGGTEGTFEGGAPVGPGALPTATVPSATPATPGTTASPTADPGTPGAGSTPSAFGTPAPRTSTPDAAGERPARPVPGTTARRPAAPDDAGGGPDRGPVRSAAPRPVPTPARTAPAPSPTSSPVRPPSTDVERCGAPENPYGYTYCGGALVHDPAPDVCRWFVCVPGFWAGRGYLTVCADGRIGMVGGPTGRCPERAGRKDPVYADQPAAR